MSVSDLPHPPPEVILGAAQRCVKKDLKRITFASIGAEIFPGHAEADKRIKYDVNNDMNFKGSTASDGTPTNHIGGLVQYAKDLLSNGRDYTQELENYKAVVPAPTSTHEHNGQEYELTPTDVRKLLGYFERLTGVRGELKEDGFDVNPSHCVAKVLYAHKDKVVEWLREGLIPPLPNGIHITADERSDERPVERRESEAIPPPIPTPTPPTELQQEALNGSTRRGKNWVDFVLYAERKEYDEWVKRMNATGKEKEPEAVNMKPEWAVKLIGGKPEAERAQLWKRLEESVEVCGPPPETTPDFECPVDSAHRMVPVPSKRQRRWVALCQNCGAYYGVASRSGWLRFNAPEGITNARLVPWERQDVCCDCHQPYSEGYVGLVKFADGAAITVMCANCIKRR